MSKEPVECSTYLHFKGGKYRVLFEGLHADGAEPVVVYVSMIYGTVWVRNRSEWNEVVEWPDGEMRQRFIRKDFPDIPTGVWDCDCGVEANGHKCSECGRARPVAEVDDE